MSDFQQTVDLREKTRRPVSPPKTISPIEEIYQEDNNGAKKDWQKISRPKIFKPREGLIRLIVFILAVIVVGATVYILFFRNKSASVNSTSKNWYAVIRKDDGMVYYGQIFNINANPVVINNVYYDYDQDKAVKAKQPYTDTGNLRLVKQGKATYGPDSISYIYQCNISKLDPLRADSKVLKAILEYEK